MTVNHHVNFDLSKRNVRHTIPFSSGDVGSHKVIFSFSNGSDNVDISDAKLAAVTVMNGVTDGKGSSGVVDTGTVFSNNTVVWTPSAEVFKGEKGNITCVLTLSSTSGATLYAPVFYMYIDEDYSAVIETEVYNTLTSSDSWGVIINATEAAVNAEAWAVGTKNGAGVASNEAQYANSAKDWANVSIDWANVSIDWGNGSMGWANDSQAWAEGTRSILKDNDEWVHEDVSEDAPQYNHHAKYWAEQARDVFDANKNKVLADLNTSITNNTKALNTLNGNADMEGSVDNKIATALSAILENDDETLNSLKELVDWVETHAGDAADLVKQVEKNKDNISENQTAISNNAENISQNASSIEKNENRIVTLENTLWSVQSDILDNTHLILDVERNLDKAEQKIIENEKRIENLEGTFLTTIVDKTAAYKKTVPDGAAKYAVINKVGGITYKRNLFNESAITSAIDLEGNASSNYGIVVNGYLKAIRSLFARRTLWAPFTMHLTEGYYTISADCYVGSSSPSTIVSIGLSTLSTPRVDKFTRTSLPYYNEWKRVTVFLIIEEEGDYYFGGQGAGTQDNYLSLDVRFKNIQIVEGRDPYPGIFLPYSEEDLGDTKVTKIESRGATSKLIDTFEIPAVIQGYEGYGVGISASECNYIDFDRKVFVNEYEAVDGAAQKRDTPTEKNVSAHLTGYDDFMFIEVENGGTLIFENENGVAVPSTVTYITKA